MGQDKSAPAFTAVLATEVIPRALTHASGQIVKPGQLYPMFEVTILGVTLIIDLAPDQPGLRDMRDAATIMGESLYVFPTKRAARSERHDHGGAASALCRSTVVIRPWAVCGWTAVTIASITGGSSSARPQSRWTGAS